MPRKLKTYQTSQGFFEMAIAAPSMKAALQAWGMKSNLFHQGFAWESNDKRVIEATMAKPGVTLRRPVGSRGRFVEHPGLPKDIPTHAPRSPAKTRVAKQSPSGKKKKPPSKQEARAAKKAAEAFAKRQRALELKQRQEERARAREDARRERAVAKVQAQLEKAEREHDARNAVIEKDRKAIDAWAQAEERRWQKTKDRLIDARKRAGRE
jgi:colicin import membrane protein